MSKNNIYALFVGAFLAFVSVSGIGFLGADFRTLFISIWSGLILIAAFWRQRGGLQSRASYWALVICFTAISIMLLQLVPLPPQIWSSLPGRGFLLKDFAIAGIDGQWLPLSLSPYQTKQDIIALLPGLAVFFAVVSLPAQNWRIIVWSILGLAIISALVGLMQRFQGATGIFNFYNLPYNVYASGFFANRNMFAAQLYCAVPLIAVLVLQNWQKQTLVRFASVLFGLMGLFAVVGAVGASSSRMGVFLVAIALLSTGFLFMSARRASSLTGKGISLLGGLAAFAAVIVFAQLSLSSMLRFTENDVTSDYRGTIYDVSFTALKAFFPVGSGFGSFVPIYQLYETPSILLDTYVNHAHNDWLELVLEGGLPIAFVLFCFVIWFLARSFYVWNRSNVDLLAKAASVSALLLLIHSAVEFPLRGPMLMCLFGIFCGMMAANAGRISGRTQAKTAIRSPLNPGSNEPIQFKPRPGGFSGRSGPSE